ncbi:hypothetical protein KIL84_006647 [Mauremys mutica]|uniref:Uncharacterized protein n=1 Tax=Mauremys mutica TaxID=74926 RepID=A0A9D4AUR6_9SAUR|nr:hypothetical protein KIL84_006647 [Mauremys mutica]
MVSGARHTLETLPPGAQPHRAPRRHLLRAARPLCGPIRGTPSGPRRGDAWSRPHLRPAPKAPTEPRPHLRPCRGHRQEPRLGATAPRLREWPGDQRRGSGLGTGDLGGAEQPPTPTPQQEKGGISQAGGQAESGWAGDPPSPEPSPGPQEGPGPESSARQGHPDGRLTLAAGGGGKRPCIWPAPGDRRHVRLPVAAAGRGGRHLPGPWRVRRWLLRRCHPRRTARALPPAGSCGGQ